MRPDHAARELGEGDRQVGWWVEDDGAVAVVARHRKNLLRSWRGRPQRERIEDAAVTEVDLLGPRRHLVPPDEQVHRI